MRLIKNLISKLSLCQHWPLFHQRMYVTGTTSWQLLFQLMYHVECCFRILKIRMLEGPSTAMGGEENQDSLHESGINLSMACSWNLKLQTAAKVSTMGLPTCIYVHIPTCGHFLKGYKESLLKIAIHLAVCRFACVYLC